MSIRQRSAGEILIAEIRSFKCSVLLPGPTGEETSEPKGELPFGENEAVGDTSGTTGQREGQKGKQA